MADSASTIRETIRLKSFAAEAETWLTISISDKTCTCPEFTATDKCRHLSALGLHRLKPFTPRTHPTFSQALSGLVKSIRIRRIEDAVYWLVFLDTFKEPQYRFRTARRILIGSAEDGHSIAVIEQVVEKFRWISKPQASLIELVAEAVRICKVPGWWDPASGGTDYIYQSLVGQRRWWYREWDRTAETLQREIAKSIDEQDRAIAVGGVMAFDNVRESFGSTKQAEFLLTAAQARQHAQAERLISLHLSARSALSGDNNFLCQAAWMMAGGESPVADQIEPVTLRECEELLTNARERWNDPQPIPRWCMDGVHSAGDDPRFMGCLPEMWAVCRAYQQYGRVDPADEWLPDFRSFDGLIIERDTDAGRI